MCRIFFFSFFFCNRAISFQTSKFSTKSINPRNTESIAMLSLVQCFLPLMFILTSLCLKFCLYHMINVLLSDKLPMYIEIIKILRSVKCNCKQEDIAATCLHGPHHVYSNLAGFLYPEKLLGRAWHN